MSTKEILAFLEKNARPDAVSGMARYGISAEKIFGVSLPVLRSLAKSIGRDHDLACQLWKFNSRETRILAGMIEVPGLVTDIQMEGWVKNFDSWEICDQVCMNLFEKMTTAYNKACQWSRREEEFVKRAGFVLMARLAVSDKKAQDSAFLPFFPLIEKESSDSRHMVKKGISWALRQIGKRTHTLNLKAVSLSEKLILMEAQSSRWIGREAYRELTSFSVCRRLAVGNNKKDRSTE